MLFITWTRFIPVFILLGLSLVAPVAAKEQEATTLAPAPPPTTQPETAPVTPAPSRSTAQLLDPDLLAELYARWIPSDHNTPLITDGDNVTVLSIPTGYAVYLAPVELFGHSTEPGMPPRSVESVIFESEHFVGETPLTVKVPPGDHVLVVRAMSRHSGFDGGCVSKSTFDLITGGHRYSYHIYPLRKLADQYQCFIANFVWRDSAIDDFGEDLARRGTFDFAPADLRDLLIARTKTPPAEIDRVVRRLNQLGIAFYNLNDYDYLVKLTLVGNRPEIMEWRVE